MSLSHRYLVLQDPVEPDLSRIHKKTAPDAHVDRLSYDR